MNHHRVSNVAFTMFAVALSWFAFTDSADGRTVLRNICRIKGQEENTLRGLGLVIGLNGTGEANDPQTMRALERALDSMGNPIPQNGLPGSVPLQELRRIKNVALVWVTADVPATGARRGDKLNCHVSAINGKSLEGGRLALAALKGPNLQDPQVYALAEGAIHLDSPDQPMVGTIHDGCQMEADVFTPFRDENGFITLILDRNHATFETATFVADDIRRRYQDDNIAVAKNAANIVVRPPDVYADDPVAFISEILSIELYDPDPEARVVINERTGSIVISGDVEIGDVVVSHRNLVVEAGESPRFERIDPEESNTAKLRALVDALNTLKVPSADAIEIIKGIQRNGKLHGHLVLE